MSLGSGALDLACTDLIVGGSLQLDSAPVTGVRHVDIQAGGTINGGLGSITLSGNWTNSGTFNAGSSQINFDDSCGTGTSTITGNTTFFDLSLVSSSGKTFNMQAGSTQTIINLLTILGAAGNPLQIRSTLPGQLAFTNLLGNQNIAHVGVSDNTATGVWLAPFQANEGGNSATTRWFGDPNFVAKIPTLGPMSLLMLTLLLGAMAMGTWARRQRVTNTPGK